VFLTTRSGFIELWLANADGSAVHQLTQLSGDGFPITPSWSPDGKQVVFAIRRSGATNLAVANVQNGAVKQLTTASNRNISPFYDSDGRYVYYDSNANGMERIWRMEANGKSPPEQMFWDVPWIFVISSTDQSIFFEETAPGLEIAARDLATGSLRSIFRAAHWLSAPGNLCVHGKTLYVLVARDDDPDRQQLVAIDIASGSATILKNFDTALPEMNFGCTVSPAGSTLIVPAVERFDSDIYVSALAGPPAGM
jgi:Tol biopolymer transport system component